MEIFGQTYKAMREQKSYKQKEIYTVGKPSKRAIQKFEQGHSVMRIDHVQVILNKVFISWREYLKVCNPYSADQIYEIADALSGNYRNQSYKELSELFAKYKKIKSPNRPTKICEIVIEHLLYNTKEVHGNKKISLEKQRVLRNLLNDTVKWGEFERFVFSKTVTLYTNEELDVYFNKLTEFSFGNVHKHSTSYEFILEGLLNGVLVCLQRKEFDRARFILKKVQTIIDWTDTLEYLYYKNTINFYLGLLELTQEDESGDQKCRNAYEVLKILGNYRYTELLFDTLYRQLFPQRQPLEVIKYGIN